MESRMTVDEHGITAWYNENGKLHRDDGPALIWADGSKIWYQNGERHREGGPAVIYSHETEIWCQNGNLHREDGPAVIWSGGGIEWWVNGKNLSFTEWADVLNLDHTQRLAMVLKWNLV